MLAPAETYAPRSLPSAAPASTSAPAPSSSSTPKPAQRPTVIPTPVMPLAPLVLVGPHHRAALTGTDIVVLEWHEVQGKPADAFYAMRPVVAFDPASGCVLY